MSSVSLFAFSLLETLLPFPAPPERLLQPDPIRQRQARRDGGHNAAIVAALDCFAYNLKHIAVTAHEGFLNEGMREPIALDGSCLLSLGSAPQAIFLRRRSRPPTRSIRAAKEP
jgi:hypothetical protein